MSDENIERAKKIRLLLCDVDGVLNQVILRSMLIH